MSDDIEYEISSGNVFADMDLSDAKERLAKAELAMKINSVIKERGLKQAQAATLLRTTQAKISLLSKGRLNEFSLDRLFRYLMKLDLDIKIIVKVKPRSHANGTISVTAT